MRESIPGRTGACLQRRSIVEHSHGLGRRRAGERSAPLIGRWVLGARPGYSDTGALARGEQRVNDQVQLRAPLPLVPVVAGSRPALAGAALGRRLERTAIEDYVAHRTLGSRAAPKAPERPPRHS